MQFRDFEPSGGNKFDLQQMIQQLGTGIAQNMQQRRQRQETAAGLQAMLPKTTPEQADMMAGMDPNVLSIWLKEKMREADEIRTSDSVKNLIKKGQPSGLDALSESLETPGATMGVGPSGAMPGVGPSSDAIGGLDTADMQLPDRMTKAEAAMYLKENADLRKVQEQRRGHDIKREEGHRLELSKRFDDLNNASDAINALELNLDEIRTAFETGQPISGATLQLLHAAGLDRAITNPTTQQLVKSSANLVINTMKGIKGIRSMTNWMGQLVERSKLSEYNTPEGAAAIADSVQVVIDAVKKIIDLRKGNLDKFGKNLLNLPANYDQGIENQIKAIQKDAIKQSRAVIYKHSGIKFKEENVESLDSPTTYNTLKDGVMFQLDDGTYVGSDGRKQRKAKVEMVGKNPIFKGWLD